MQDADEDAQRVLADDDEVDEGQDDGSVQDEPGQHRHHVHAQHLAHLGRVVQRQDLARDQEHDADGGVPAMVGVLYFGHFLLLLTVLFGGESCVSDIFFLDSFAGSSSDRILFVIRNMMSMGEYLQWWESCVSDSFFYLVIAGSSSNTILQKTPTSKAFWYETFTIKVLIPFLNPYKVHLSKTNQWVRYIIIEVLVRVTAYARARHVT